MSSALRSLIVVPLSGDYHLFGNQGKIIWRPLTHCQGKFLYGRRFLGENHLENVLRTQIINYCRYLISNKNGILRIKATNADRMLCLGPPVMALNICLPEHFVVN